MFNFDLSQNNYIHRMKQIQKSNFHVNNIIQSAKKIIHHQQQLSSNQKQVLQIKISIEKDHLKNSFYKINTSDNDFHLEIIQNTSPRYYQNQQFHYNLSNNQDFKQFSPQRHLNQKQKPYKHIQNSKSSIKQKIHNNSISTNKKVSQSNLQPSVQDQPDTKITVSRFIDSSSKCQSGKNTSVSLYQNQNNQLYQINFSNQNQASQIHPLKTSKLTVSTKKQPINISQRSKGKNNINSKQKQSNSDQYTPTFLSHKKQNQQAPLKFYQNNNQIYEKKQINITTPSKYVQIISTQTQQHPSRQSCQSILSNKKISGKTPKTQSLFFNNKMASPLKNQSNSKNKESLKSTSYKQILQKNKSRLETSRQKHIDFKPVTSQSKKYELHLDELMKKKEQNKKRLYGPPLQNQSRLVQNSFASKKYSIANSRKIVQNNVSKQLKGLDSRRSNSRSLNDSCSSLSQSKRKPLHSSTLKSYHQPCLTCSRCKINTSSSKQPKQSLSSFYLAKKYLTPEGQQQCYNFLKSQGIPQSQWSIFITEYVYRQLSKAYQQVSPKETSIE